MHYEVLDEKGKRVFSQLKDLKDFYLAGGTALALQIGHRISVDFDLFTSKKLSKLHIQRVGSLFLSPKINISVNNSEELTFFVDEKKVTLLHYPFPVLFKLARHDGMNFLNVKEIAATKAYTIGRRGFLKDYIDIYFILLGGYSALTEIMDLASKKFGKEFNSRLFLEQLVYLEDIEEDPIVFLKKKITKGQLMDFFEGEVKNIRL